MTRATIDFKISCVKITPSSIDGSTVTPVFTAQSTLKWLQLGLTKTICI